MAAADPVLLVAGSAPATLLDFPAALGTVGARNSEQGIFPDCAGAGLGPSNLLAASDTGVVSPCRVTYLLGKVQQMGSVPLQHNSDAGSIPGTGGGIRCSVAITTFHRGTDGGFGQARGDDPQTTESG